MNISVYDDTNEERYLLICYIKSYYHGRNPKVIISECGSGDLSEENVVVRASPDIAFICHDSEKGIQIARHIREFNKDCTLILISNTLQYGLQAYELGAVHYLLKPIGYSQICEALKRCEKQK